MTEKPRTRTVLPDKYSAGPYGIGDPDDKSLRKIEKDVLIKNIVREKSRNEKCSKEFQEFYKCSKAEGLLVVLNCRKENDIMKECLKQWFHDEKFNEECKQEYLDIRSEYRRTGIGAKHQKKKPAPAETR